MHHRYIPAIARVNIRIRTSVGQRAWASIAVALSVVWGMIVERAIGQ
jgi:hypothetical protein